VNASEFSDREARVVAELSSQISRQYGSESQDPWQGSPFQWIQRRPSRQKGAIAENLVEQWALGKGFTVEHSNSSDADRIINGHRVEIKFSSLWTDTGSFRFQQIRDQRYDYCFCLGLSPWDCQAWFIPKSELMGAWRDGLKPQHGGAAGHDTRWLAFPADNPPPWLRPFGGRLEAVESLIRQAGQGPYRGH